MTDTTNCPDCAAPVGEQHADGCDVARCHSTGRQRLSCDDRSGDHCGFDTWTGRWPGETECEEFGWWVQPGELCGRSGGWIPCERADEGAQPDLTRLVREARWDAAAKRWRRREVAL